MAARERRDGATRQGRTLHRVRGGLVEIEGGGAGLHHVARFASQGVEQILLFKFCDEGLADGDKGFELAGFIAEVPECPETLHHAGGLGGEGFELGEVGGRETREMVALEVDDADHVVAVYDGCCHFATTCGPDGDVARLYGDVGCEERAMVEYAPAGDAVAEFDV